MISRRSTAALALAASAGLVLAGCTPSPTAGAASPASTATSSPSASSRTAATSSLSPAAERPTAAAPAEYFTGEVELTPLYAADQGRDSGAGEVTFQPGARSYWHTHPAGQTLVVTEGSGWAQDWNGERIELHEGDVLTTPAGVKHWHGATADDSMTHIAVTGDRDGENVDWMEAVTDTQYTD